MLKFNERKPEPDSARANAAQARQERLRRRQERLDRRRREAERFALRRRMMSGGASPYGDPPSGT